MYMFISYTVYSRLRGLHPLNLQQRKVKQIEKTKTPVPRELKRTQRGGQKRILRAGKEERSIRSCLIIARCLTMIERQ